MALVWLIYLAAGTGRSITQHVSTICLRVCTCMHGLADGAYGENGLVDGRTDGRTPRNRISYIHGSVHRRVHPRTYIHIHIHIHTYTGPTHERMNAPCPSPRRGPCWRRGGGPRSTHSLRYVQMYMLWRVSVSFVYMKVYMHYMRRVDSFVRM